MTVINRSENMELGKSSNLPHAEKKIISSCSVVKDREEYRM